MKKYNISFIGRLIGALGLVYTIHETIISDSRENAIQELYKKYEHIKKIKIEVK